MSTLPSGWWRATVCVDLLQPAVGRREHDRSIFGPGAPEESLTLQMGTAAAVPSRRVRFKVLSAQKATDSPSGEKNALAARGSVWAA